MRLHCSAAIVGPLLFAACSDPTVAMDAAIATLDARPEHTADLVEVEHVLIAFAGTGIDGVTRSRDEARRLAAELWQQATTGADFRALRKKHSDDPGPGIYAMTKSTRASMVAGFGNVGWRLAVGEIGVAPYEATKSPFGWHVIKRLR